MATDAADIDTLRQDALEKLQSGKLQEALALLHRICSIDDQDAIVWYLLSTVHAQMDNMADAETCCRKALELNQDFPQAWNNLGNILNTLDIKKEAANCYLKAISQQPDLAEAHINLGELYRELGEHESAIKHLEQSIQMGEQGTDLLLALADCYLERAQASNTNDESLDSAIEYYKIARERAPHHYPIYRNIALTLRQQGLFDRILAGDPFNTPFSPGKYQTEHLAESAVPRKINVMFFMSGNSPARHAELLVRSATSRMQGTHVIQLTDPETATVDGVNEVIRTTGKIRHLMFTRVKMYAAAMKNIQHDSVLVDTDVVILKDLSDVFGDWDIALTVRDDSHPLFDVMPFNEGVILCRPTEGARRFWNAIANIYTQLPEYLHSWSGGQISLGVALGKQVRERQGDLLEVAGIRIKLLPGTLYNYTPDDDEEDLSAPYIVHYKGERKGWMLDKYK